MPLNSDHTPEKSLLPMDGTDDEYELITSEEVDRTLDALDQLISAAASENVRSILEEAADAIYGLVYSEEEANFDAEQEEAA